MDDVTYITENMLVLTGLSPQSIRAAFSPSTATAPMYMPLLWISYMADVTLLNASPTHPWGFHFTNVLLHALTASLLFVLFAAWCKKPWRAFFWAAVWAVHPLRVESVAWVTERKDVLSGLFCLLSVGCYVWANRKKLGTGLGPYLLAFMFYGCGLLVKPSVVPLFVVLLLLDIWPLRRLEFTGTARRQFPRLLIEKAPFFAAAAAIALATVRHHHAVGALSSSPLWERCLQVPIHYGFYLGKFLAPLHLGPLYPLIAFSWPRLFVALVVLLGFSLLAWKLRIQHPNIGVGWLWFLFFLAPIIGFFGPVGVHSVADRFTYLPAMGLSMAFLFLWPVPTGGSRKTLLMARVLAAGLIIALLGLLTLRLLPIWQNGDRLFARISYIAPHHPAIQNVQILHQLKQDGNFPKAQSALEHALATEPQSIALISSIALCLHEQQGTEAALDFLIQHRPTASTALGEWEFQMAMYSFLGAQYSQVLAHVEEARHLFPPHDAGQNNLHLLGMAAAFELGDPANALAYARSLPPYRTHTEIALADLFPLHAFHWDLGLRRDALAYFRRLIQSYPDRGDLLNNTAWILATADWSPAPPGEVVALAQRAVALAPAPHPVLLDTLAVALANAGDFDAALHTAQQALALVPETGPNTAFRRSLLSRITLYQHQHPYREETTTRLWANP
ncbi:MAG: hypothetical protein PHO14_00265 [Kiritimatiellae bacterium]|nr:hypothetical protein [Kiritimatiellia bacterium]MDD4340647.1 hypothetical protein [Kiritimatiellia bacterium]